MNAPDHFVPATPDFVPEEGRFPELHELLDSYASDGWVFTDTPEEPSVALQAYIRQMAPRGEVLDRVIAEIDDLLRIGLFNEEIADEVDNLPHIDPPKGGNVEACLSVIRSHLDRVRRGEDYERSDLPQTDWEWRTQFPEVGLLLGGYFHQDFPRFYGSHREALDDYLAGESDSHAEVVRELDSLLTHLTSDSDLERATRILGLGVYPPEGVSLRQWLTDVRDITAHHLGSGAPGAAP